MSLSKGKYRVSEIRNLPSESFCMFQNGTIVNPLMPGIVTVGDETEVYQYIEDTGATLRIDNFTIVRDESTPYPSGQSV